jgi:nucleoside-diphosphate kinase
MLKPDCVERGLSEDVFKLLELYGFKIIIKKRLRLTQSKIDILYDRCRDKDFYPGMLSFLLSGDVIVYIVECQNAINRLNEIVGDTNPENASPNSIRGKYGQSVRRNITHSSMNEESFWKELHIFFNEDEISKLLEPLGENI